MLTSDKRLVLVAFIFVFFSFLVMGTFMETTVEVSKYGTESRFDAALPVGYSALGEDSSSGRIKAMIKGSIYEEGSNMTVFGACFDGDGYLLPGATASFTAWYPDGTIMVGPNASMYGVVDYDNVTVPSGRWAIQITMGSTIGTYLTEIRCEYLGDWAVAFGEWQNPEWVKRIGDTQQSVNNTYNLLSNVSSQMTSFQAQVQDNVSQILNGLSGLNATLGNLSVDVDLSDLTNQVRELYGYTSAIDLNMWSLCSNNPFYVLGSGTHMFSAVDMLSPNLIGAVSTDGYYVYWDGETWQEVNTSYSWNGISVAPANAVYAYLAGTDGINPVLSVNGAPALSVSLPSGSPTEFTDVAAFLPPNNPAGAYYLYLLGNDGSVYLSNDSATTWAYRGAVGANDTGRISDVVVNYVNAQPQGYLALIGQGGTVAVDNGNTFTTYSLPGGQVVGDVGLKRHDLGYVVAKNSTAAYIYKYNGTALKLDYVIQDSLILPTGVAVNAQNDVWVSTTDPSTFYHFDGYAWEHSVVGFSNYVSVVISFGNASNVGLRDLSMFDSKNGYAVGADGMCLKYEQHYDERLDSLQSLLINLFGNQTNLINNQTTMILQGINASQTAILLGINDSTTIILGGINQSQTVILQGLNQTELNLLNAIGNMSFNATEILLAINASELNVISSINSSYLLLNTSLTELYSLTYAMNQSLSTAIYDVQTTLNDMNLTINYKLDSILSNVTYTQLYLETTLFPLANATYQNTVNILISLGIIDAKLNTTIELQNQTLNLTQNIDTNVQTLLNKSNRIRAWITQ